MKIFLQLIAISIIIISVPAITGCPGPRPASQDQDQTGQNGSANVTDRHDVDTSITNVGMDLLAELGYDVNTLEVSSMEISPGDNSLLWRVVIGNGFSNIADFRINEESLRFELLNFILVRDGVLAPSSLGPDESPLGHITEALGLQEEGYRLVVEKEAAWEYRKYADWNEWQIAVSHVVIMVPLDEDAAILIDYRENELMEPVSINIDRDDAVSSAESFLDDPAVTGTEPTFVDLIQREVESGTFTVFWEVMFGDHIVQINADDGSIL